MDGISVLILLYQPLGFEPERWLLASVDLLAPHSTPQSNRQRLSPFRNRLWLIYVFFPAS